jgi:hypothetical protein
VRSPGRCPLVRQVGNLHRRHDALDDHGRAKSRSQAQKQHFAALVAAQRLHGRVIDDLHGTTEGAREIEPDPAASKVVADVPPFQIEFLSGNKAIGIFSPKL